MKLFFTKLAVVLCTLETMAQLIKCLDLVDFTERPYKPRRVPKKVGRIPVKYEEYKPVQLSVKPIRRYWLLSDSNQFTKGVPVQQRVYEDEKDSNIKQKIAMLVEQTMQDAHRKMKLVDELKEEHRDEAPYKAGFILSMVKKSKDVLDELFNVAVKHKDEWMALEQLKIFELIVHTNVDTTNLLRQLVDVHVKHINATRDSKRVILI
ncbi:hypothetical protein HF086_005112 [Spodoptera exigua]|uniref:Uncharacterized protein n=1 Tax=Spodoptera exigua TaxID=7107 RepID=A0A922MR04_SPOEX|nr:hypothetical protein HF086_005112 [Spodoptera exigua]